MKEPKRTWSSPEHWWTDVVDPVGVESASFNQLREELRVHRPQPKRQTGDRRIGIAQEVGDAGHDAHVGDVPDRPETLLKDGDLRAGDHLSFDHHLAIAAVGWIHVALYVGVSNKREDSDKSHLGADVNDYQMKAGRRGGILTFTTTNLWIKQILNCNVWTRNIGK